MDDERAKAAQTLGRIAAALGIDATAFGAADGPTLQVHQETMELMHLFTGLTDPTDRRACLDFVRAVADRGRAP